MNHKKSFLSFLATFLITCFLGAKTMAFQLLFQLNKKVKLNRMMGKKNDDIRESHEIEFTKNHAFKWSLIPASRLLKVVVEIRGVRKAGHYCRLLPNFKVLPRRKWISALIMLLLFACVSTKKVIEDATAFVITPQRGTVAVDENGNEILPLPSSVIIVFVHSKSNEINWDTAWIGNQTFTITQQLLTQPIEMGIDVQTGKRILIEPTHGSFIYQLQVEAQLINELEGANTIRIRGSIRKKALYKEIIPIRSLKTPRAQ